jgi:hypothetical protein
MTLTRRLALLLLLLLTGSLAPVHAQSSASHRVHIGIEPITVMALSGDPLPLNILLASGSSRSAIDASSFYNLTTNVERVEIEARLDEPLPAGLRLRLRAESSIGSSLGVVTLVGDGRARRVVANMDRGLENGQRLEYELVADPGMAPVPFQSRTVVLSLVNPQNGYRQDLRQLIHFSVLAPEAGVASATN